MDNLKSHLILFSTSFPYGNGEQFLESEIKYLATEFDIITIIPYNYGSNKNPRSIPSNVYVTLPLKPEGFSPIKLFFKGIFNLTPIRLFINELFVKKFFHFRFNHLIIWFRYSLVIRMIVSDKFMHELINNPNYKTVVYFYWGKIHSAIIPFIEKRIPSVVRFHGGDLYEERAENKGYIPFRKVVLSHIHTAIFISDNGEKYLKTKYSEIPFQSKIFRLGVKYRGESKYSTDNYLRIVSCSTLKPLKRVHILAEALQNLNIPVTWTHIGDGSEKKIIENIVKKLPYNINVNFTGNIPNNSVYEFYLNNSIDLFVNVSEYEGIPVSIMEALSFSIPVFASDVGGIPELIDSVVGRLLPVDITPLQLSEYLNEYYFLTTQEKIERRHEAHKRWYKLSNADVNYVEFSKFMKSLIV